MTSIDRRLEEATAEALRTHGLAGLTTVADAVDGLKTGDTEDDEWGASVAAVIRAAARADYKPGRSPAAQRRALLHEIAFALGLT